MTHEISAEALRVTESSVIWTSCLLNCCTYSLLPLSFFFVFFFLSLNWFEGEKKSPPPRRVTRLHRPHHLAMNPLSVNEDRAPSCSSKPPQAARSAAPSATKGIAQADRLLGAATSSDEGRIFFPPSPAAAAANSAPLADVDVNMAEAQEICDPTGVKSQMMTDERPELDGEAAAIAGGRGNNIDDKLDAHRTRKTILGYLPAPAPAPAAALLSPPTVNPMSFWPKRVPPLEEVIFRALFLRRERKEQRS